MAQRKPTKTRSRAKAKPSVATQTRAIKAAKPELTLTVKDNVKLKDLAILQEAIFDRLTGCPACLSGLERIVIQSHTFKR